MHLKSKVAQISFLFAFILFEGPWDMSCFQTLETIKTGVSLQFWKISAKMRFTNDQITALTLIAIKKGETWDQS